MRARQGERHILQGLPDAQISTLKAWMTSTLEKSAVKLLLLLLASRAIFASRSNKITFAKYLPISYGRSCDVDSEGQT